MLFRWQHILFESDFEWFLAWSLFLWQRRVVVITERSKHNHWAYKSFKNVCMENTAQEIRFLYHSLKYVSYVTHYKSMKFVAFVQCIVRVMLLCGSAVLLASWRYMISVHEQPALMRMINFAVTFDDIMICTCLWIKYLILAETWFTSGATIKRRKSRESENAWKSRPSVSSWARVKMARISCQQVLMSFFLETNALVEKITRKRKYDQVGTSNGPTDLGSGDKEYW